MTTFELPLANSYAECPKCGAVSDGFVTAYHEEIQAPSNATAHCANLRYTLPSQHAEQLGEHLCKRCRTCGFKWMEAVLTVGSLYERPDPSDCACDHHGDHLGCDHLCNCWDDEG